MNSLVTRVGPDSFWWPTRRWKPNGLLEHALASLTEAGLVGEVFQRVDPEPYLDNADEAANLGRGLQADIVIGMGGGSAMDTAKAAAILITNEGACGAIRRPKPRGIARTAYYYDTHHRGHRI